MVMEKLERLATRHKFKAHNVNLTAATKYKVSHCGFCIIVMALYVGRMSKLGHNSSSA